MKRGGVHNYRGRAISSFPRQGKAHALPARKFCEGDKSRKLISSVGKGMIRGGIE